MVEQVGECESCGKAIYCDHGFLDGVYEQGHLFCSEACADSGNNISHV
ncbi:hypothetical protein [Thalassobacillus sp. CUG 92003]|nr:hypothetical protein [Thalassobacillus sp. CUG 92003]